MRRSLHPDAGARPIRTTWGRYVHGNRAPSPGCVATAVQPLFPRQYVRTRWSVGRDSIAVSISTSWQTRSSSVRLVASTVAPPAAYSIGRFSGPRRAAHCRRRRRRGSSGLPPNREPASVSRRTPRPSRGTLRPTQQPTSCVQSPGLHGRLRRSVCGDTPGAVRVPSNRALSDAAVPAKPSRITARVRLGRGEILDIEREIWTVRASATM